MAQLGPLERVGGDHGVGQIDPVEQVGDLGDLGGVLRDGDLGDDDLLLVEPGGEELDVDAGGAGAVVDDFAVDGRYGRSATSGP